LISYELRTKIEDVQKRFNEIKKFFNEEKMKKDIKDLEAKSASPDFWNDMKNAQETLKKVNSLKKKYEKFQVIKSKIEELEIGLELSEEGDEFVENLEEGAEEAQKLLESFEMLMMLNGKFDTLNCYLSIHPGAGGTESHDWASMLLRMYTRWAERNGFEIEEIDIQPGDEAGINSATILIKGDNAYGLLKHERGVHRLVRISPFDAAKRRHTSFASVNVIPEFKDEVEVEVKDEDLKIDTYRSSGAGGQHVNRTDSAVRITHLPTGIVVTCQNERSQIQNREVAMRVLKARLYQLELEKRQEKLQKIQGNLKEIGWGSQIRSYVFQPYTMVKDHRTNHETGNIQAVMDGEIDDFIYAELVFFAKNNMDFDI
jgi:peptide chain release factor 2